LRLREITGRANRGSVTFYPIDARGLAVYDSQISDGPPPLLLPRDTSTFTIDDRRALSVFYDNRTLRLRQDALRDLADQTGGIAVVNTNNLEPAMARIVETLSSFYLLGYYSTNPELDGRYRTIDVKVSRRGIDVRHRRGYRGRTADVAAGAGQFLVSVPESGRLDVGDYAVRVNLRAASGDALPVSETTQVRMEAVSPLGEALLWRSGPSTGREYRRTADQRFQRSERLRLELASTDPAPAHARLLDRTGAPLPVPVTIARRPDPEAELTWIVADLSLAPLAPGDYAVEVVQGDAWQVVGFRIDG
jgi:hypothetical protein